MNTTSAEADIFRTKLKAAAAIIAKEMGMAVQVSGVTYGSDLHAKVTLTKVGEGIDPMDETATYKNNVKIYGIMYGVTEEMIGLKNRSGEEFVGVAPSRAKYPIVIRKPNGKIMLSTVSFIDGMKLFNNLPNEGRNTLTRTNPPTHR